MRQARSRSMLNRSILVNFLVIGLFSGQIGNAATLKNPACPNKDVTVLSKNTESIFQDGAVSTFKDSYIISMTPWKIVEASESMPRIAYPAYIGTGRLGIGIDAAGLQSLSDQLRGQRFNLVPPYNVTQSDLYVLHDGIMSEVLIKDEVKLTKTSPDVLPYGLTKNFMPFCFLNQTFKYSGKEVSGDEIYSIARQWKREWNLQQGILRTSYVLDEKYNLEIEMFAPYGGETVYCKLTRQAVRRGRGGTGDNSNESFRWEVFLPLKTHNGMPLFDEPGAVKTGKRTLLASVTEKSSFNPSERYGFLYGVAADKADISIKPDGLSVIINAPLSENSITYFRFDFHRLVGEDLSKTTSIRNSLETVLSGFNAQGYQEAMVQHIADYDSYWAKTADIEVQGDNPFETKRRYMLHMSQYLLRTGNDYSCGGTIQFLLFHNNGWAASNFHDDHYIIDGLARSNMWDETLANLKWMKQVMRTDGRPFPWMLRYNGERGAKPERDRAPMSDANRALLAMRIYELGGKDRDTLLKKQVYPIIKAVVEMSLKDWFYEKDGRLIFRGVETDVMGQTPIENDLATVLAYITLFKKAVTYSEYLGLDEDRRKAWQDVLNRWKPEMTASGRYAPQLGASDRSRAGTWLCISEYLTECHNYLDPVILRAMNDNGQPVVRTNIPWISFAAASSEMRLGRPDRSEQFFRDNLDHRVHGPGYFEEVYAGGIPPPYASAHGSHLVAACEQVMMSDFWSHSIEIGTGLPSSLRTQYLKFHSLRGRDGVLVSGELTPKTLEVNLHHTGDPVKMNVVMSIPCQLGPLLRVCLDGKPVSYTFQGEHVMVNIPLEYGRDYKLTIEDGWGMVNTSQFRQN